MQNLSPPKEDTWAFVPIGAPFPDNPVKCLGQQNMYVALWYKHGKPIHGRSWNNGGVVECSFPYNKAELTGAKELDGQIQVLQYKGTHITLGYWYNWIKYKERFDKTDERQMVKCGDSFPILWLNRPQGALLGYVDNKTELALFSHDKICESKSGGELSDMMIIVRELKGGPPTCDCPACPKGSKPVVRVMLNEWADFRAGDPFPPAKCVRALFRSLSTLPGENPDQYVALWYQQGEVLFEMPEHVRGFDYDWRPYPEAASFGAKEWHPVHVNHYKGDISPGVIVVDGKEILGKVDVKNERASYGYGGKEVVLQAGAVHSCKVLCRKAKPGCKFD